MKESCMDLLALAIILIVFFLLPFWVVGEYCDSHPVSGDEYARYYDAQKGYDWPAGGY